MDFLKITLNKLFLKVIDSTQMITAAKHTTMYCYCLSLCFEIR